MYITCMWHSVIMLIVNRANTIIVVVTLGVETEDRWNVTYTKQQ